MEVEVDSQCYLYVFPRLLLLINRFENGYVRKSDTFYRNLASMILANSVVNLSRSTPPKGVLELLRKGMQFAPIIVQSSDKLKRKLTRDTTQT
jgi:hypothetical protein